MLKQSGFCASPIVRRNNGNRTGRQKEAQQSTTFLQDIPNAFVFEYAGQKENAIRLTFRPSLQFRPSSREDKVLHQMAGEIWVDGPRKRLISISGTAHG
jgi:hypothetical protein